MAAARCDSESSLPSSANRRCLISACRTQFEPTCSSWPRWPGIGVRTRWVDSRPQPRRRHRRRTHRSSAHCCSRSGPRTDTPRKNTDRHGSTDRRTVDKQATTLDPYNLTRFTRAQESDYERALGEIRAGQKRSHWMWYVFPQVAGLGSSATSVRYAINSREEASAYLAHPVLGPRLLECAQALLRIDRRSALQIFGSPDDMKLRSSATLFASVSRDGSVFDRTIDKYFGGQRDERTIELMRRPPLTPA